MVSHMSTYNKLSKNANKKYNRGYQSWGGDRAVEFNRTEISIQYNEIFWKW